MKRFPGNIPSSCFILETAYRFQVGTPEIGVEARDSFGYFRTASSNERRPGKNK